MKYAFVSADRATYHHETQESCERPSAENQNFTALCGATGQLNFVKLWVSDEKRCPKCELIAQGIPTEFEITPLMMILLSNYPEVA